MEKVDRRITKSQKAIKEAIIESWLKDGMPTPPLVMAKELGILLERIV